MDEKVVVLNIFKTFKELMHSMKQSVENEFKELNLTAAQISIINYLMVKGDSRICDLGKMMGLTSSTISGIADRLEKHGYVNRIRSKEDRREVRISLDTDFKEKISGHYKNSQKKFANIMRKLDEEELENIYASLKKMKIILKEETEKELNKSKGE